MTHRVIVYHRHHRYTLRKHERTRRRASRFTSSTLRLQTATAQIHPPHVHNTKHNTTYDLSSTTVVLRRRQPPTHPTQPHRMPGIKHHTKVNAANTDINSSGTLVVSPSSSPLRAHTPATMHTHTSAHNAHAHAHAHITQHTNDTDNHTIIAHTTHTTGPYHQARAYAAIPKLNPHGLSSTTAPLTRCHPRPIVLRRHASRTPTDTCTTRSHRAHKQN